MMTIDEAITVLRAAKEGKQIEYRMNNTASWICFTPQEFNFIGNEYRVKREPCVIYVNIYPDGSIGQSYRSREAAESFSRTSRGAKTLKLVEEID